MKLVVRNVIAVILGVVIGSIANMSLIGLGSVLIPPPAGVDSSNFEGLKAGIHLFEPKHFLFPFLAHALGTVAGAFTASIIAATHRMKLAMGVSVFFLIGGIAAVMMIPSPLWFAALDLIGAYLPMGWLGGKTATGLRPEK